MLIDIDSLYLDKDSVARFKKVLSKIKNSYLDALTSSPIIVPKSDYLPKIYVIPFVRKVVLPDREIFVFNEVFPDPLEEKHRAFFLSLPFLEAIEAKYVTAIIAHEFAHLIDFARHPNRIKELWEKHKGNAGLVHNELDQKATEYYRRFKEPVKTWLYELDEVPTKNRILNQVIESDAEVREFKDYINEFPQYLKSRIKTI